MDLIGYDPCVEPVLSSLQQPSELKIGDVIARISIVSEHLLIALEIESGQMAGDVVYMHLSNHRPVLQLCDASRRCSKSRTRRRQRISHLKVPLDHHLRAITLKPGSPSMRRTISTTKSKNAALSSSFVRS